MDSSIKSLANELSKLFQAQLNSRFIALKLLSIVAVLTSKAFDMAITFNKLGYNDHLEYSKSIQQNVLHQSNASKIYCRSLWNICVTFKIYNFLRVEEKNYFHYTVAVVVPTSSKN